MKRTDCLYVLCIMVAFSILSACNTNNFAEGGGWPVILDGDAADADKSGDADSDDLLISAGDADVDTTDVDVDTDNRERDADNELVENSELEQECETHEDCTAINKQCVPDEWHSETSHCKPFCNLTGGRCPYGFRCNQGLCREIDNFCFHDTDCELDEICDTTVFKAEWGGVCITVCFVQDYNCPEHTICSEDPHSLNYGRCILDGRSCDECESDEDCEASEVCNLFETQRPDLCHGVYDYKCCLKKCNVNEDCVGGLICRADGRCGNEFTNCGGDCPHGYICDPLYNQCVLNCPACGANTCCDVESSPHCYTGSCNNPAVCGLLLPSCCFGYCCSAIIYGVLGYCI